MTPDLDRIYPGDALAVLRSWPAAFVQTCVCSPPYFGLRDYGVAGQLGLEKTPQEYVEKLVAVFREVRRVLRDDGTLWLNMSDSYAGNSKGTGGPSAKQLSNRGSRYETRKFDHGVKPKDLVGVPWLLAFALRADGWYLRADIIWAKKNCMPESVEDRPTRSHEYIFLLSKNAQYYYDHAAICEPTSEATLARLEQDTFYQQTGGPKDPKAGNRSHRKVLENLKKRLDKQRGHSRRHAGFNDRWDGMTAAEQRALGRNKRSVWFVATQPFAEAHFATFPPKLIEPCVLAGCPDGGVTLDPFMGSGTTALVASRLNRRFLEIELNPKYIAIAEDRIRHEVAQGKFL